MEKESEEKLIVAKLKDKIRLCKTRNRMIHTEFLNKYQEDVIQKELNHRKEKNYLLFGGYESAESKILILYPDKLTEDIVKGKIKDIIKAIKITLPNEQVRKISA